MDHAVTATLTHAAATATLTHHAATTTLTHAATATLPVDISSPPFLLVKLSFAGYDPGGLLVGTTLMETLVVEQSSCHQLCSGGEY